MNNSSERQANYFEGWFRYYKEPRGPLREEQARALHQKGEPYAVVLGDPSRPFAFVEVNSDFFGVSFLDRLKREELGYVFEEIRDGQVFLSEATYREFSGDADSIVGATIYSFQPDGLVHIEKTTSSGEAEVSEAHVDVSKNWEQKPAFGAYESITRRER